MKKIEKKPKFAVDDLDDIDYKNVQFLQRYLSSYGKIMPRRKTGISAKAQRRLAQAIKRARYLALIPYTSR